MAQQSVLRQVSWSLKDLFSDSGISFGSLLRLVRPRLLASRRISAHSFHVVSPFLHYMRSLTTKQTWPVGRRWLQPHLRSAVRLRQRSRSSTLWHAIDSRQATCLRVCQVSLSVAPGSTDSLAARSCLNHLPSCRQSRNAF
jgi:hypothetical protein